MSAQYRVDLRLRAATRRGGFASGPVRPDDGGATVQVDFAPGGCGIAGVVAENLLGLALLERDPLAAYKVARIVKGGAATAAGCAHPDHSASRSAASPQ
jgi:hypothetical protein